MRLIPAAVAALTAITLAGCAPTNSNADPAAPPPAAGGSATPAAETSEPAASYSPTKADFNLKLKILRKECFGTAGCNVTYRVDVAYAGSPLDPDTEYEVTYKILGGEDGSQINTLTVQGDQATTDDEELVQTPSSGTRLRVVVTDVSAS